MTIVYLRRAILVSAVWLVAVSLAVGEEEKAPETHTVAPGPFQVQVDLEGIFESEQMTEVILRPEVFSSLVVEKAVPQGTKVAAGDRSCGSRPKTSTNSSRTRSSTWSRRS